MSGTYNDPSDPGGWPSIVLPDPDVGAGLEDSAWRAGQSDDWNICGSASGSGSGSGAVMDEDINWRERCQILEVSLLKFKQKAVRIRELLAEKVRYAHTNVTVTVLVLVFWMCDEESSTPLPKTLV